MTAQVWMTDEEIQMTLNTHGADTAAGLAARLDRDPKQLRERLHWMAICGLVEQSGRGVSSDPYVWSSMSDPFGGTV